MKTIFSAAGGAISLTEDGGVFSLNVDESISVGGGEAAGVLKVSGKASAQLDVESGVKLGEAMLNSHLPVSVQALAAVVEGIANQALKALE